MCGGKETADGSLIEELERREAAARAGAERLRARIEELTEELARAEEQVWRLAITREDVMRVLKEPPAADAGGQDGGLAGNQGTASPIGAVTVPPWQEGDGHMSSVPRWRDSGHLERAVGTAGGQHAFGAIGSRSGRTRSHRDRARAGDRAVQAQDILMP